MIVRNPRAEPTCPYRVSIPVTAHTLEGFRIWARSEDFPRQGRISFVGTEIVVDMSPERYSSHGAVKTAITRTLSALIDNQDLGEFYPDRTLLTYPPEALSHEPDAMFATWETLRRGRLKPISSADQEDAIEWEGVPDLVVEILSPSTKHSDTGDLLPRFYRAGVRECWLIDARKQDLEFEILTLGPSDYQLVAPGRGDWLRSPLFNRRFRLERTRNRAGRWKYTLHVRR